MKFYVTRHGQTALEPGKPCVRHHGPPPGRDRQGAGPADRPEAERHPPGPGDCLAPAAGPPKRRSSSARAGRCPCPSMPGCGEQNYGIYEGVSRFDQGFLSHKRSFATRYPGGESHMSTAVRVYSFLEDTARNCPGESVLVVCHGGICRIIESYFHDMTNEEFFPVQHGQLRGAGSTSWSCPKERGGETW